MPKAICVHQFGGPEVLDYQDIEVGMPKAGEVRLKHTVLGVNYIDTYFRTGLYKAPSSQGPLIPGHEAVGVIEALGEGVEGFEIGDRVATVFGPGAYATHRVIGAQHLIPLPQNVSDELAAAVMLKGLTAQYLLRRTFKVGKDHKLLFHAAAGGVGLLAGRWARYLGALVIGTAGSEAKIDLALRHGFHHVINYRDTNFVDRVFEITGGERLDVVYDSVGKDTFPASLDVIKRLGLFVSFGQSSGPIPPFDIGILNAKGSLFMTRPSLMGYNFDRATLLESAAELFDLVGRGIISVPIHQRFALSDARSAHEALEGRATTGSTLLMV
jgi:NADPH:quinone reductase